MIKRFLLIATVLVVGVLQLSAEGLFVDGDGNITTDKTIKFGLNKLQIGGLNVKALPNADNTSDANKPVSIAQQTALDLKLDLDGDGSALVNMTRAQVGLTNVEDVDQTDADNISSGTVGIPFLPVMQNATGIADGAAGIVPKPLIAQRDMVLTGHGFDNVTSATGGTVSNISIVTANGVSGVVVNSTTTPAITLSLGAILPTNITVNSNTGGGSGFIDLQNQLLSISTPSSGHARIFVSGGIPAYKDSGGVVHGWDKAGVGLSNADNTSDINKPVSTAQGFLIGSKQAISGKDVANGYAGLDANRKIDPAELPTTIPIGDIDGLVTALANKQGTNQKGVVNGYAGLDGGGKVPLGQTNTIDYAHGGTNATTQAGARSNLLPDPSGHDGETLLWDGADYVWAPSFSTTKVTILTTLGAGTYTLTSGPVAMKVEAIGGGAGGATATGGSSQYDVGGGGGSGGYAMKYYGSPAASYNYYVGAGGAADADGVWTWFESTSDCRGNYGLHGLNIGTGTTPAIAAGGQGAPGSGAGDVVALGSDGGQGFRLNGTFGFSGVGAASLMGGSVQGRTGGTGAAGYRYGGGGAGGAASDATPQAGGPGAQGVIIITESIVIAKP